MNKLSIKDFDLRGKRVLMRVDYNVPMDKKGHILDDTRMRLTLPTINHILSQGGRVVLMSHLGRPKGHVDKTLSLHPIAKALGEMLNQEVAFCTLDQPLGDSPVTLLENLRFDPREEDPTLDPEFAKTLATYGDIYVNDAFGTAHRFHSSTGTITEYFPHQSAMGLLLERELCALEPLCHKPPHPFCALIGGAKVSTKIGVMSALLDKVDHLFIGGGMLFTFLKVQGQKVGSSLVEESQLVTAEDFLTACERSKVTLSFPEDIVIADQFSQESKIETISINREIPDGWLGLDIGPRTIEAWRTPLTGAKAIFWNGPMGVFEIPKFAEGTKALARLVAECPGMTVVGGGDSVAAINELDLSDKFTHISTGGGAALEYIENGHLPGIDALSHK